MIKCPDEQIDFLDCYLKRGSIVYSEVDEVTDVQVWLV